MRDVSELVTDILPPETLQNNTRQPNQQNKKGLVTFQSCRVETGTQSVQNLPLFLITDLNVTVKIDFEMQNDRRDTGYYSLGAHWNTFRISWIPWITHNRHPQKSFSHTPSVKKTSLIMAERTSMTDVWQDHTSPIPRLLWSLSWQPYLRTLVGGTGGLMVDQHKQLSIWLSLNPWYGVNSPVKLCHWELSLSRMTLQPHLSVTVC